jgi:hypothetical protein
MGVKPIVPYNHTSTWLMMHRPRSCTSINLMFPNLLRRKYFFKLLIWTTCTLEQSFNNLIRAVLLKTNLTKIEAFSPMYSNARKTKFPSLTVICLYYQGKWKVTDLNESAVREYSTSTWKPFCDIFFLYMYKIVQ